MFMPGEMKKQIDNIPIVPKLVWITNASIYLPCPCFFKYVVFTAHRHYCRKYFCLVLLVSGNLFSCDLITVYIVGLILWEDTSNLNLIDCMHGLKEVHGAEGFIRMTISTQM